MPINPCRLRWFNLSAERTIERNWHSPPCREWDVPLAEIGFMYRSLTIWESQSMAAAATAATARLRLTSKVKPLPLTLVSRCLKMVTSLQHIYNDQELLHWITPSLLNFPLSDSTVTMYLQLHGVDISESSGPYSPLRRFRGFERRDINTSRPLKPASWEEIQDNINPLRKNISE